MSSFKGKVPSNDLDAETVVLADVLLDAPKAFAVCRAVLSPQDFYSDANKLIFAACCMLADQNKPIDVSTVASCLREKNQIESVGGAAYLAQIVDTTPSTGNTKAHARVVKDHATKRAMVKIAETIAAEACQPMENVSAWMAEAELRIAAVAQTGGASRGVTAKQAVEALMQDLANRHGYANRTTTVCK